LADADAHPEEIAIALGELEPAMEQAAKLSCKRVITTMFITEGITLSLSFLSEKTVFIFYAH
ncbi:hypothetical protein, partial [Microcoleus sp. herbarium2]|uniref:hypothetical protein n=1 Tax=Microcoleus sp. herbarium2 TaxID=3055433 RepID=UPI002FD5B4C2